MKLSLRKTFIGLLIREIIALLVLGGLAYIFNAQLVQNQNNFLKTSIIDKARFTMSSALSNFLFRQENIALTQNLKELSHLPERTDFESQFSQGLHQLSVSAENNKQFLAALKELQTSYQNFLKADQELFNQKESILILRNELTKRIEKLEESIQRLRNAIEGINGSLILQSREKLFEVENFFTKHDKDNHEDLQKYRELVNTLIRNDLTGALNVSARVNANFIRLVAIVRQLSSEADVDELNHLKGNQTAQLVQLLHTELQGLINELEKRPDLLRIAKQAQQDFDSIANELIESKDSVFHLQLDLINKKENLITQSFKEVQKSTHEITEEFNSLDRETEIIRTRLIDAAEYLARLSRWLILGAVFLILALTVPAGYFLLKAILRSLNSLIKGMSEIVRSKGVGTQHLSATQYKELNQVVDAFNLMAEDLNFTQSNLKELVEIKTKELREANTQLNVFLEELKKLKEEAEGVSQMKSNFLATMSHELRTPLNAIIGYSEMMLEEAENEEANVYTHDLKKVIGSAKHLLSLINEVLDLSKIEAGKMDLHFEDVDVREFIQGLKVLITPMMEKNKNTFILDISENCPGKIYTDQGKVQQSLLNLLSNASKFTKSGVITLEVKPVTADGVDWLRFAVQDTGIGIPPEKLAKLFNAFTQADSGTTRYYGGSGLGLYLAKLFSQMLGGSITSESEVNKGSTFAILLPTGTVKTKTVIDNNE